MRLHELIRDLSKLAEQHGGDLPVENEYGHEIDAPEFNDDDGPPCILVSFSEQ